MAYKGKIHLTVVFTCPPELVAEGDRIFASHAPWMERTHPREGKLALHSYDLIRGPELSNPLDPGSEPTGNMCFVISETYESHEAVSNHWHLGATTWEDFPALIEWAGKCKVTAVHSAPIVHSLW